MAHTLDSRATRAPRFLRFACAIALTSGVGASASGCYASHEGVPAGDAGPRRDARTVVADTPPPRDVGPDVPVVVADAPLTCADCDCVFGVDAGPRPSCDSLGLWSCCAAIGPCAPPDLPA